MTWSFPLGRLFGSDVRVHATFFLLLAWIAVGAWIVGGPAAAAENLLFVLALFACVLAHEFGHALMARRYGIATPDITLLPIGGLARLERMPDKPGQEIAVALAGPAVNVVIWLALTLILGAETRVSRLLALDDPAQGFLGRLAAINLFLVIFNMIPAFPMDGGRVLRAVLALALPRVTATRIAATAGQVLAFLFGFLGLTTGNPILVLIAIFVFLAAAAESGDVALRETARNLAARDAMITAFEALSPDDSMDAAAAALIRTTQAEFPVIDHTGALLGFVTRSAILGAFAGDGGPRRVSESLETVPEVRLTAPLTDALDALYQGNRPAVAVIDRAGTFLGYITRENIGELMVIRSRR
jgi:Zn-dependent protease/CBS domain-containing protein